MDKIFKRFYRGFFLKTGGYIPSKPLNQVVLPGDLIQIHDGQTVVLGNIYRQGVVATEQYRIKSGIRLHPANWQLEEGVSRSFLGTEQVNAAPDEELTYRRQVFSFKGVGSYFFHGAEPEAVRIDNWQEIAESLIVKLTTTQFSFREVYLVTETVSTAQWTMAVAGGYSARLELMTAGEVPYPDDLLRAPEVKTSRMREIAYHHRQAERRPAFFRARKLCVRQDKVQQFYSSLVARQVFDNTWARDFFEYDIFPSGEPYPSPMTLPTQASVLDLLQANQLNPNTALEYFRWEDASLNDVERLFLSYGI